MGTTLTVQAQDLNLDPHVPHKARRATTHLLSQSSHLPEWRQRREYPWPACLVYAVTNNKRPCVKQGGKREPTPKVAL